MGPLAKGVLTPRFRTTPHIPEIILNFILPNPGTRTQVLPNGQLWIMHTSPEDAGNYFCIAQNSVGSAMAKTRLVVQGGPRRDLQETWLPRALRLSLSMVYSGPS